MKTLVITNDYSPKKGGISTYIQSFCKNLNFETYIYVFICLNDFNESHLKRL